MLAIVVLLNIAIRFRQGSSIKSRCVESRFKFLHEILGVRSWLEPEVLVMNAQACQICEPPQRGVRKGFAIRRSYEMFDNVKNL